MDDYYQLLGVSPDASRDEIKDAYRSRRETLGSETAEARSEASRLNRAWNVLSDPLQRERYDARLAEGESAGEEGGGPPVPAGPPRRGLFGGPPRQAAPLPAPTIELPPGRRFAEVRSRIWAMVIDLVVIVVVGLLLNLGATAFVRHQYPDEVHAAERFLDQADAADEKAADAGDRAAAADDDAKAADQKGDDAAAAAAREKAKRARAEEKTAKAAAEKARDDAVEAQRGIGAALYLPFFAPFVVGLLYLVVPSALTGQTLGKRLRGLRVVRLDGSPPGWSASIVRYGLPALVAALLATVLGPLAVMVALIGVLMWLRNPNQQGLHDRAAKTVVVVAD